MKRNWLWVVGLITVAGFSLSGESALAGSPWGLENPWVVPGMYGNARSIHVLSPAKQKEAVEAKAAYRMRAVEIRHKAPNMSLRKSEPPGYAMRSLSHQWVSRLPESGHNYLKLYSAR